MRENQKTISFLILAMLAWGSVYPVSKYLMAELSPMVLGFFRYFTAVITLTPFVIIERLKNSNKIGIKNILIFVAAGLTGTAVFAVFLFSGVARSTASNGSIIINTQPVFTAILAPLFIKEVLSKNQIAGIVTGFTGMFLVVTGGKLSVTAGESSLFTGNMLLVCGAISMSVYGIIIKSPVRELGGLIPTWYSMAIGTFFLLLINLFTIPDFSEQFLSPSGRDLLLILYLGTIATAAAYLLFSLSLKHINVITATAFKFLIPVSGVGLSILFLGERPVLATYAGIIIVIFSVFLIQHPHKGALLKKEKLT